MCESVCALTWGNISRLMCLILESRSAWWIRNNLHPSAWLQRSPPMRIHAHARSHAHDTHAHKHARTHQSSPNKYNPILDISISISKLSKICERKIWKEFLLGLLTKKKKKNDVCLRQMRAFFFTQQFSAGEWWVWHQCVGMSGIWWSLRFVVETLLVNDMPLSSRPTLRSPPIPRARRDNEVADSPKNFTQRGEESAQRTISAFTRRNFLFFPVSFLLRLFPDSLQMLVQTCSNSPTDQVRGQLHLCNSNVGGLSGSKSNLNVVYKQNCIWV